MNIFLLIFYAIFNVVQHEYYLSVSTLKFHEKSIEIEIRVFKDDLEKVLGDEFDNLEIFARKAFIYFQKHLKIYADGNLLQMSYIGLKDKGDAVIVYGNCELRNETNFNVVNTIFIQDFSDQKNVLHIYRNDKIKTTVLDARNTTYTIP